MKDGVALHYLSVRQLEIKVPYIEEHKAKMKALKEELEWKQSPEYLKLFEAEMKYRLALDEIKERRENRERRVFYLFWFIPIIL